MSQQPQSSQQIVTVGFNTEMSPLHQLLVSQIMETKIEGVVGFRIVNYKDAKLVFSFISPEISTVDQLVREIKGGIASLRERARGIEP